MHKTYKVTLDDKKHLVLDVFSHRVEGLDTPEECASALLAVLDVKKHSSYSLTSEQPVWLNGIKFNSGSWALSPWQSGEHTHSHYKLDDETFTTPSGALHWREFRAPASVKGCDPERTLTNLKNEKHTDLTFMSVLVGVLDQLLPLDFPVQSAYAHINTAPILAAARACILVLKPWAEQRHFPSRGHGSRPFPLKASTQRAYTDVFRLIYPTFYGGNRKHALGLNWFLQNFVQAHILAPNKPFQATTWVKGANFERFKSTLPQDLVELGQGLAWVLPQEIACDDIKILFEDGKLPENMSAHQHIQLQNALLKPALHLKQHADKHRKRGGRLSTYPLP
jgi:hypothetical protein